MAFRSADNLEWRPCGYHANNRSELSSRLIFQSSPQCLRHNSKSRFDGFHRVKNQVFAETPADDLYTARQARRSAGGNDTRGQSKIIHANAVDRGTKQVVNIGLAL